MSSTIGRRSKAIALATMLVAILASCVLLENQNYSVSFANSPDGSYDFVAYTVGDSVQLYGSELYESMSDTRRTPSSDVAPNLYTWTSTAPDKVEAGPNGLFVMKAVGNSTISVRTKHNSFAIPISVIPPRATIRLSPRDTVLSVGAGLTVVLTILDSVGSPQPVTPRASDVIVINHQDFLMNPVLAWELNTYRFSTLRAGTGNITVNMRLYKRPTLTDVVAVTVKP